MMMMMLMWLLLLLTPGEVPLLPVRVPLAVLSGLCAGQGATWRGTAQTLSSPRGLVGFVGCAVSLWTTLTMWMRTMPQRSRARPGSLLVTADAPPAEPCWGGSGHLKKRAWETQPGWCAAAWELL